MLKITMIRHGKTEGSSLGRYIGTTDESLLEEEKKSLLQIRYPAAELVYCSPLKRSLETAAILYPQTQVVVIPELAECDFGSFEGKTYQELLNDPDYKNWVESGEITSFPNGENKSDFQERVILGFEKLVAHADQHRKSNVAMIAHSGTIVSILDAYGFPSQEYVKWFVDNGEGYQVRLAPDVFLNNEKDREIIVDGKIVRDED